MDSSWSDEDMLRQNSEASFSKKLKTMIIMLSLVLIILLLPLASDHGLRFLRPMGSSMLQRLWDAMRFIAMTAAISVFIISTSSHDKDSDGSSDQRLMSSFSRPSGASEASTSRGNFDPLGGNTSDSFRSDSFSQREYNLPAGDYENGYYRRKGKQNDPSLNSKGKEVMDDQFSSADGPSESMRSQIQSIKGSDFGISNHAISETSADNLANDDPRSASNRFKEIEENLTVNTANAPPLSVLGSVNNSPSNVNFQDKLSTGAETTARNWRDKGQIMMYDSDTELRFRKNAISRIQDESNDERRKKHQRSSSVDWQRPKYVYDQENQDQPGVKQILMDLSRGRQSQVKMSDLGTSEDKAYKASERFSRHSKPRVPDTSNNSDEFFVSSVDPSFNAGVHHQPLETMTLNFPSDASEMKNFTDTKIMQDYHRHRPARNQNPAESLQTDAAAGKEVLTQTSQGKHVKLAKMPITTENTGLKQVRGKAELYTDSNKIHDSDHTKMIPKQQQVGEVDWASYFQNDGGDGDTEIDVRSSLHKNVNPRMISNEILSASNSKQAYKADNIRKPAFESNDRHSHHGYGRGSTMQVHNTNASRFLKQSGEHSQSDLNLYRLGQADQNLQWREPFLRTSSGGRKSFSVDFGDSFGPHWLLKLEPPLPPQLLGTDVNHSLTDAELQESLLPWRSTAPIDPSSFPRSLSPLESLNLPQGSYPSRQELKQQADEYINYVNTRLSKQRYKH